MCGSPCAMLWTRPRDPEPGALPGRAGEKAGSHGGLDAPAAVAAGGSVAGMLGPDLASVGAAPWQECRDAGDDRAGARGFGGGMGKEEAMTHPNQSILALYAGQDLGWFTRRRTERHLARCRECRDEVQVFASARDNLIALNELPAISWNRLAAEMEANIRLGLAAGECVRGERTAGRLAPFGILSGARTLTACASVMALVAAGLILQRPTPPAPPAISGDG